MLSKNKFDFYETRLHKMNKDPWAHIYPFPEYNFQGDINLWDLPHRCHCLWKVGLRQLTMFLLLSCLILFSNHSQWNIITIFIKLFKSPHGQVMHIKCISLSELQNKNSLTWKKSFKLICLAYRKRVNWNCLFISFKWNLLKRLFLGNRC